MSNTKSQYLLLFRGTDWYRQLSVNELQEIMGRANAWFAELAEKGIYKAAQPLDEKGATIAFKNGAVSDGPFTESKESVGGYLLLEAESLEEAVAIGRQNPMVPYGLVIEVRPVSDDCGATKLARQKDNAAVALA